MSNKFLTPQIVANEALMVLENNLVAADLVHKDYSKEFAHVVILSPSASPRSFPRRTSSARP